MLLFKKSKGPTIGVELELQIIDCESYDLINMAPQVLKKTDPSFRKRIKEEFLKSMIELNTDVCENLQEVEADLRASLHHLNEVLKPLNAIFYSASLHPFARGNKQLVSENPRYLKIMEELQIVGRRFITQGLHVHIGVEGPEKAVNITNTIRIYLPLLLALSTSSPFYEGEYTGLYSYRTKLFEALPKAGMPDYIYGWDGFTRLVDTLLRAGYIDSVKDLWWDVRPHPEFGTVEVRICDIPCRLRDILAITALIQALVVYTAKMPPQPDTNIQILRLNKWQAARYGLDGLFADPSTGRQLPIRQAIEDLLIMLEAEATTLGSGDYLQCVNDILREGTGADLQMKYYEKTEDFREVIKMLTLEFYK